MRELQYLIKRNRGNRIVHLLRPGNDSVRQLENLRRRQINANIRALKIWKPHTYRDFIPKKEKEKRKILIWIGGLRASIWLTFKKTFLLPFLPAGVEGGDSEVDGHSQESSGSGEGEQISVSSLFGGHFLTVSFTFRHFPRSSIGSFLSPQTATFNGREIFVSSGSEPFTLLYAPTLKY